MKMSSSRMVVFSVCIVHGFRARLVRLRVEVQGTEGSVFAEEDSVRGGGGGGGGEHRVKLLKPSVSASFGDRKSVV